MQATVLTLMLLNGEVSFLCMKPSVDFGNAANNCPVPHRLIEESPRGQRLKRAFYGIERCEKDGLKFPDGKKYSAKRYNESCTMG